MKVKGTLSFSCAVSSIAPDEMTQEEFDHLTSVKGETEAEVLKLIKNEMSDYGDNVVINDLNIVYEEIKEGIK